MPYVRVSGRDFSADFRTSGAGEEVAQQTGNPVNNLTIF
jgi:hypothetical protein